jgi:hypothetical protein
MPVSYEHKFIFIHIPKCAGSSIRKAFKDAGVQLDWEGPVRPEQKAKYSINEKWLHHLHASALKRILPEKFWEESFKFSFVRNPWDRLVSKYHFNKRMYAINPHFRQRRPEWADSLDRSSNFEEWVRLGIDYVRPSMGFITDENGKLLVDFVGRHENLQQDFNFVCEKIGIHAELPHEMKSVHTNYRDYYNEEAMRIVQRHFAEEIDFFKYKFLFLVSFLANTLDLSGDAFELLGLL